MARIGWIDEFKGFVLLLVCLFHVEQSFSHASMGMLHLSALRMSAFFFISGVLFSTRRFSDFKSYFVHKTKVLLWPYIALSLLFLALDPVVYNFTLFPKAPRMTIMNIHPTITSTGDYIYWNLMKIFVAGKSSIGSGPLWFVFTLYSVSLIFYGVQNVTSFANKKRSLPFKQKTAVAGIATASLVAGWFLYKNHIRLPLGIERDLTVLFFFACGWLCKDAIKKLTSAETKPLAALAIFSLCIYAYIEIPDPNFSIMNNDLGKSFVGFAASSVSGIVGLVASFILASRFPNTVPIRTVKGILRNISRNALIILAVHWYILLVMRLLFKAEINRPGIVYISIAIVATGVTLAIPLFRCKLYKLLGKEPTSIKASLSIKD